MFHTSTHQHVFIPQSTTWDLLRKKKNLFNMFHNVFEVQHRSSSLCSALTNFALVSQEKYLPGRKALWDLLWSIDEIIAVFCIPAGMPLCFFYTFNTMPFYVSKLAMKLIYSIWMHFRKRWPLAAALEKWLKFKRQFASRRKQNKLIIYHGYSLMECGNNFINVFWYFWG